MNVMSEWNMADDLGTTVIESGDSATAAVSEQAEAPASLEAGGSDARFWIKAPIGYGITFADARVNWKFQARPSPGLDGRGMYWPRGRVVGGSSSINAMIAGSAQFGSVISAGTLSPIALKRQ